MVKTRKYVLARPFKGMPKESDMKIVEEELGPLKDGQILCEAVWFGVDPLARYIAKHQPIGATLAGSQIAKIIESRNKDFPVGKHIVSTLGWQTHTIHDPKIPPLEGFPLSQLLPEFEGISLSHGLGAVGSPGLAAYFGFLEICKPKPGETVVVSGAAGSIGNLVGQIARIRGCKVIGITGSDLKVQWLKKDLHFDAALNYKTMDLDVALKEAAPKGVDCYFDNVGGVISSTVISHMNTGGRISVCGFVSTYNDDLNKQPVAPVIQGHFIFKQLKMEGFFVFQWLDRWMEGVQAMLELVRSKQIVVHETVTEGFENLGRAFVGLMQGENLGKSMVKV